jgi:hypothetical protein
MLTMKTFEAATLPESHLSMGSWRTFNEVNVRAIAERVRRFETLGEAAFIAGKMTPVMQLTDVAVAFGLKKILGGVKAEVRRSKRGELDMSAAFREAGREETTCSSGYLMRILGLAWRRMLHQDEVETPERLLKAARTCGWLS